MNQSEFDLESLSHEELLRLSIAAKNRAVEKAAAGRYEALRAQAIEAMQTAPADRLPAVLAALKVGKKRASKGVAASKEKSVFKWDDVFCKNRKVDASGEFVEPPVFMRGRYASTPTKWP